MNWDELKRLINPNTNPGLYTALASLAVSCWQAVQVESAKGPLTWSQVGRVCFPVVIAALAGVWQRNKTTPLKSPRDGNGMPLLGPTGLQLAQMAQAVKPQQPVNVKVQPGTTTGGVS